MSRPAWEYLTTHLPEIRQAVLPNTGSKIGEPGLALLLYLSGQTNLQGEFFMTAKAMQEETGLATLRQVEKLLAGFVVLGWITPTGETNRYMNTGRPTPVYVLTLFPQYARLFAQTLNKSEEIPSGGTVEELSKANRQKDYNNFRQSQSEPEPEPDRLRSDDLQTAKAGKEREEILNLCIDFETAEMQDQGKPVTPGLIHKWRTEFPPYIAEAIKNGHGDTPEAIARWCIDTRKRHREEKRTGYTSANTSPHTGAVETVCGRCSNKNRDIEGCEGLTTQWNGHLRTYTVCEQCNGTGQAMLQDMTEDDYAPHPTPGMANCLICDGSGFPELQTGYRKCVCIGGTYTGEETLQPNDLHPESVDTDQARSTDTPAPPGQAYPQSVAPVVKELRKVFKAH